MDSLARPILAFYGLSNHLLSISVKDLSEAEARARSRGDSGASIAWTIGHLCHWKIQMLALMGKPKNNPFAAQFDSTPATDGSDYPPVAELLASFSALASELSEVVAASPGRLEESMPNAAPHDEKKIFDSVLFLAWHEAYHIGTLGLIRKGLGRKSISDLAAGK